MQTEKTGGRYALLDELRGVDLLNMFVYHALWDLVFLYGLKAEWYTGWLGRHSLVAYLLHQPVIYGLLLILDKLF